MGVVTSLGMKWRSLAPLPLVLLLVFLYLYHGDDISPIPRQFRKDGQYSLSAVHTGASGSHSQRECHVASAPTAFTSWVTRKNYTRAIMRPQYVDAELPSIQTINGTVFDDFQVMDGIRGWVESDGSKKETCPPVVDVSLPADLGVTDTRKLLFGAATTVERLEMMLPSILSYLGPTNASMLVMVPPANDLEEKQAWFRTRGLDVTLKPNGDDWTVRYFGLVRALSDHIRAERQDTTWVSFVDDDTFFPSLHVICKRLSQYNATENHYFGALSEAKWQQHEFGHIGFGGAGVFLSKVLLDTINEHYDECQGWGDLPGDQKLARCVDQFARTELTIWPELHQFDLKGEPDGIFESGRELQSLHHWASWYQADIAKIFTVSAAAGQQSALKRWKFNEQQDETGRKSYWVLTNGYSIIEYSIAPGAEEVDFDAVEHTWAEPWEGYVESLGPLRPKDQDGVEKKRWMLKESVVSDGNVHQFYHHDTAYDASVIELVWLGK